MDELLSTIEAFGGEDHCLVRLESVSFVDNDPILTITIRQDWGDKEWRRWRVVVSGLCEYSIAEALGSLSVHGDEHPVTRLCTDPWRELYFRGVPRSVDEAVGRLVLAHRGVVGDWVPFGRYLNPCLDPDRLLAAGYGMLAHGPTFIVQAYAQALSERGLTLNFLAPHPYRRWEWDWSGDGGRFIESTVPLTTLIIGNSFFVAEEFREQEIGEDCEHVVRADGEDTA